VKSYIVAQVTSGAISAAEASSLSISGGSLSSIDTINALPVELRAVVQQAFREGTRWLFISLVPWVGLAFMLSLLLSNVAEEYRQPDREKASTEGKDEESAAGHSASA
jgi:hypothetical protein